MIVCSRTVPFSSLCTTSMSELGTPSGVLSSVRIETGGEDMQEEKAHHLTIAEKWVVEDAVTRRRVDTGKPKPTEAEAETIANNLKEKSGDNYVAKQLLHG